MPALCRIPVARPGVAARLAAVRGGL